jgi:hypothetical protein
MSFSGVELYIMGTQTNVPAKKRPPLFKWILVIGIMLVANLFVNYALDAFYPAPKFESFCPQAQVNEAVLTKDACLTKGGQWNEYTNPVDTKAVSVPTRVGTVEVKGYCNENYVCGKNYDVAQRVYDRNVFVVLVIAGTAFLIGGVYASAIEAVALGFSFAGILSLIIGTMRYWSSMDERLRVVVLGIALAALVWLGIKKFKDN